MLAAERLQKIVTLVNERGSIRVSELSELFEVTEETIRRDLDKLEGENKLARSHGGAVSIKESQPDVPFPVREATNAQEKIRIAEEAVQHVRPGDRIVLDASTTAWYMARFLPDFPLTVLTNSIKVAMELSAKEKIEVISTGGTLSSKTLSYIGPQAERALDPYHVNKAFLSSKGVHEQGISESSELHAIVKRKMVAIADRAFLLADYSKFGVQAFTRIAGWESLHTVITDSRTEESFLARLREKQVEVIRVGD
ncbi:DeoR/GlpR family DNA-binding transcription regulator [Paenibacillus aurantius]|uniref:DeoR/GlpR family DNA-binding transcription regulator n=1 Tax=Paenibacillus aurantius TaxID=2918900 RepID=A0AA96LGC0_9BACL|nr:DeoR/GlpR family DNA-binding transcription regulator [Paenibacillus aurantius]WNQ13387.1 DeoR/GlpR family DNA-binding transcription regulator [Paenibacillus aurantius]